VPHFPGSFRQGFNYLFKTFQKSKTLQAIVFPEQGDEIFGPTHFLSKLMHNVYRGIEKRKNVAYFYKKGPRVNNLPI
jgi:hypothetical protein